MVVVVAAAAAAVVAVAVAAAAAVVVAAAAVPQEVWFYDLVFPDVWIPSVLHTASTVLRTLHTVLCLDDLKF